MFFQEKLHRLVPALQVFLCLCSALSFTWSTSFFPELTWMVLLTIVVFFPLVALHRFNKKNAIELDKISVGICIFLSLIWLMTETFKAENTALFSRFSVKPVLLSIIYVVGSCNLLLDFAKLFHFALHTTHSPIKKFDTIISKFSAIKTFVLLTIIYIPHIILAFPGAICIDAENQINQYFGIIPLTAHHPPVHTLLLGKVLQIGNTITGGHLGFGYLLFVLIQTFILLLILTYMFTTLKKLHTPTLIIFISFIFVTVSPYFTAYAATILKDCLYSYIFLLFMIELIWLLVLKQNYWKSWSHRILYFVSVCGVYLFRNNGKHVLFFFIIAYLVFMFKNKEFRNAKKNVFFLIFPLIFSFIFSTAIMQIYSIEKGSIKEALSFPFQQTARYVLHHGDEVTPTEKEAIDRVLIYDQLANLYTPELSDPVKETYKNPSNKELFSYFRVWAIQGLKHPYTYLEATIEQNQSLFYPYMVNGIIYNSLIDYRPVFSEISIIRAKMYRLLFTFPVLGLFSNIPFWNFLLFLMFSFSIRKKYGTFIIAAIPALASDLVIVFAPCIWMHPRYAFPIVYSMPLLLAYYIYVNSKQIYK